MFAFLLLAVKSTQPWLVRLEDVLKTLATAHGIWAAFVGGALVYGVHRVAIYPMIHRVVVVSIIGCAGTGLGKLSLMPWGTITSLDVDLEWFRMGKGEQMDARQRERFTGWASEAHLLYIAIEVTLVTIWWPGWPIDLAAKCLATTLTGLLGVLVGAWDRQLVVLEKELMIRACSHQDGVQPTKEPT